MFTRLQQDANHLSPVQTIMNVDDKQLNDSFNFIHIIDYRFCVQTVHDS